MLYAKKILTSNELKILRWIEWNSFQKRLSYNLKSWKLLKLRKWIYILGQNVQQLSTEYRYEIANKIYSPSYISFETVLLLEWVAFQYYGDVRLASNYQKNIRIEQINLNLEFFKMPKELITNTIWLQNKDNYTIATKERAFCDIVRKDPNYYFDDLSKIDRDLVDIISKEYSKYRKRIIKDVLKYKRK